MRAVIKSAVRTCAEDLAEIMGDLFLLHIDRSETFDSGCVDDADVIRQMVHLRKSGGVHSFVVGVGDFSCACQFFAEKGIQKRAFADS